MSIHDFLHSFFGHIHGGNIRPPESEGNDNFNFNKQQRPPLDPDFENDEMKHFSSMFDFKMTMDPFEMHQFFQEKVNDMMKSFMSPEGFPGIQDFGAFESPDVPAITGDSNPRNHYLKPGAKIPPPSENTGDEKSGPTTTWMDKFFPSPNQEGKPMQPHTFSSFKSVIRKTVTLPDGTIKTEEIIRNSDGTEERTESHSRADPSNIPSFGSGFVVPDFPGLFDRPKISEYIDPRYEFLKPGFEQMNPNSEKIDKDLDKQIEQSGIGSLPPFSKVPEILQPNIHAAYKGFTRRTVTLPNGVVEKEEIIRNPDGTEQRIVTHAWPDGTTKSVTSPTTESLLTDAKKDALVKGYDKPVLSSALQGVKDLISLIFK